MNTRVMFLVAMAVAVAAFAPVAFGATKTANWSDDTQWFNPDNWDGGVAPADGDHIILPVGEFFTGYNNTHVYSIEIPSDYSRWNSGGVQMQISSLEIAAGAQAGLSNVRFVGPDVQIVNNGAFRFDQSPAHPDAQITYSGTGVISDRDWAPANGQTGQLFQGLGDGGTGSLTVNDDMIFERWNGTPRLQLAGIALGANPVLNGNVELNMFPGDAVADPEGPFGDPPHPNGSVSVYTGASGGSLQLNGNKLTGMIGPAGVSIVDTGGGTITTGDVNFQNVKMDLQGTTVNYKQLGTPPNAEIGPQLGANFGIPAAGLDLELTTSTWNLDFGAGNEVSATVGSAPHGGKPDKDGGTFFGTCAAENGLFGTIELQSGTYVNNGFGSGGPTWVNNISSTGGQIDLNKSSLYICGDDPEGQAFALRDAGGIIGLDSGGAVRDGDGNIVIPEPATVSLLALGGLALLIRRRRRRLFLG